MVCGPVLLDSSKMLERARLSTAITSILVLHLDIHQLAQAAYLQRSEMEMGVLFSVEAMSSLMWGTAIGRATILAHVKDIEREQI